MTYQQTLDFMYSQLPMYQRQGKSAFKKDLTNIITLTKALGNPESQFDSVHIGGTNGKGTTAHIIAAGLQVHGYKVGMYTSPHYLDFRERIKVNGNFISKEEVVEFVQEHRLLFEKVKPSFFEMTVAMAFHYFAKCKVDIAIIEVGLGGRLDSTNIITPLLSVITNISYDHQAMLGNTLELIANEKAGIIKNEVPVIIGETQKEISSIFTKKARSKKSHISWADKNCHLSFSKDRYSIIVDGVRWIESLDTKLTSSVQQKNLLTGLYSLFILQKKFNLNPEQISDGISNMSEMTYYVGRYQVLQESPLSIADSAHNIAGVTALMENIATYNYERLHIVIGMVNDKDITKVLRLLPQSASYYFTKANIPRGLDQQKLKSIADELNLIGNSYPTVKDGYKTAIGNAADNDLVLTMGSIFVVAEVLT